MAHFFLLITLLLYSLLTNAQTDADTSVTKTTWFWPLLGICIALLLSIPCTLIVIGVIYYVKHKSDDDSDESSITSNSSSSTTPVQQETRHRHTHHHHHRSHYVGAFRSPPPPYTSSELPKNIFITPSLPPSYDSHINSDEPTTTANPLHDISAQPTTLDVSTTLTSPSIQTFQA